VTKARTGVASDTGGAQRSNRHAVEAAIVASWGSDTRYASERFMAHGRPGDPARGQCGATALVVQDLLGGEILVGDVLVGSERLGVHYWNRLDDGEVLDVSGAQFVEGEVVAGERTLHRPQGVPPHGAEAYLLLRARVERLLADRHRFRAE
jgi:hypothetical protein